MVLKKNTEHGRLEHEVSNIKMHRAVGEWDCVCVYVSIRDEVSSLNSDPRRPNLGYLLVCVCVYLCFSVPPEGGALSSVSVPERGVGPGERDSALSLLS